MLTIALGQDPVDLDLRWRLDPSTFISLPALQLKLLERGLARLQPGGWLVYASCALRREENEAVDTFLSRHRELEPLHALQADLCRGRLLSTRLDLHRLAKTP